MFDRTVAGADAASTSESSLTARSVAQYGFQLLLWLSGFCGISYEVLYARILSNLVGDQFAVSVSVLLTFILGIGVGALYAHRFWSFLWLIEAGIGACGVIIAFGTPYLDQWLYAWPGSEGALRSAIFLCFLVLSAPAFLIGCSVPLFAGYLNRMKSGEVFARAYSMYNFGAAATALLIEFWLLRRVGIRDTIVIIGAINAAVSLSLLLKFRQLRESPRRSAPAAASFSLPDLAALAIASIASAIFQLVMVKLAECIFGPFRETFALVLALILAGIALGSALTERFRFDFTRLMFAALVSLAWLTAGFGWVAGFYSHLRPIAVNSPVLVALLRLGVLASLMLPAAAALGATIPALLAHREDVARQSGRLLFVSSVANAFGFLVMAFMLHQYFDYGVLIAIVAAMTAVAALVYTRFGRVCLAFSVLLLVGVIALQRAVWNENLLYLGHTVFESAEELSHARAALRFAEKFKGHQDVFSLTRTRDNVKFFVNGYVSISLNSPAEKIVGAFPALFAPRTDRALVLGLGSGATGGTIALLFDRIDAVEINPVVVQNLYRMAEYNFDVYSRPGVNIIVDDGIHFAKVSTERYSLIINTVTSPLYFSSSKLYTDDFFKLVRRLLMPDGVYVTWIDSRVGDRGIDIILETLSQSFQHCWMGAIKATYYLLMCSREPIALRQPRLVANNAILADYLFGKNGLRPDWIPYGLISTKALTLMGDPDAPVNTLDYPALEFEIAKSTRRGFDKFKRRLVNALNLDEIANALKPMEFNPVHLALHTKLVLGDSMLSDRWEELGAKSVDRFPALYTHERLKYFTDYVATAKSATAHRKYGALLLALNRYDESIEQFRSALALDPNINDAHFNIAAAYEKSGRLEAALESYTAELKVDPTDDEVAYRQGRVSYKLKRYDQALGFLNAALKRHPTSDIEFYRGLSLEALGRPVEAGKAYEHALSLNGSNRDAYRAFVQLQANLARSLKTATP